MLLLAFGAGVGFFFFLFWVLFGIFASEPAEPESVWVREGAAIDAEHAFVASRCA